MVDHLLKNIPAYRKKMMSLQPKNRVIRDAAPNTTVVECLVERLEDDMMIDAWTAELNSLLAQTQSKLFIIDMNKVRFLTSSVMCKLLAIRSEATKRHVLFGICSLTGAIRDAFRLTRLDNVFVLGTDRQDLIEKLDHKADILS